MVVVPNYRRADRQHGRRRAALLTDGAREPLHQLSDARPSTQEPKLRQAPMLFARDFRVRRYII